MTRYSNIYIIENNVNEKLYIGKSVNPRKRWLSHKSDAKTSEQLIYRAMRKYGVENFKMRVIEEGIPEDLINEKEIFYVSSLKSKTPNGYNMTDGGDGMLNVCETVRDKIRQSMLNNEGVIAKNTETIIDYNKNETEEQRLFKLNQHKKAISRPEYKEWQNKHLKTLRESFTKEEASSYQEMAAKSRSKTTLMMDAKSGDVLMEFSSSRKASDWVKNNTEYTKAVHGNIGATCRGEYNQMYGYKWAYK